MKNVFQYEVIMGPEELHSVHGSREESKSRYVISVSLDPKSLGDHYL